MGLYHITYVSFSTKELSESELEGLLKVIRRKNEKNSVTGLLLYNDRSFIQVIEGEQEALIKLFNQIRKDPQHENIVTLLEEPIKKRTFPDWSMGFHIINNKQVAQIPGYSYFMTNSNSEELVKEGTREIIRLLNSFRTYT